MKKVVIEVAYDGTNYYGWQVQPNKRTIQGELIRAVSEIFDEEVKVIGAGRTDRGVHANGQVASFKVSDMKIPIGKLADVINIHLPDDIMVMKCGIVPGKFDARWSAKSRRYIYLVNDGRNSPFFVNRMYHIRERIGFKAIWRMRVASVFLHGKHNFVGFSIDSERDKNTIRIINKITIKRRGDIVIFEIIGKSFLRKMVRIIIATLLDIGFGKRPIGVIKEIIKTKDKSLASAPLPPHGLYLDKIYY